MQLTSEVGYQSLEHFLIGPRLSPVVVTLALCEYVLSLVFTLSKVLACDHNTYFSHND